MKRLCSGSLSILLLCVFLAACTQAPTPSSSASQPTPPVDVWENPTPMTGALPAGFEDITDAQWDAMRAFSAQLFRAVHQNGDENVVISPLSVYYALALAAAGSRGDTAAEFARLLGGDADHTGAVCRYLIDYLMDTGADTTLLVANSVWADDTFTPSPEYLDAAEKDFSAEVFVRDLQAGKTLKEINTWVAEKTNNLIPQLLDSMSDDVVAMLINTLYMDAAWQIPFSANDTYEQKFTRSDGQVVNSDFLHADKQTQRCFQTADLQGLVLPYSDGKLAFLAVMPADGDLSRLALNGESIAAWMAQATNTDNVLLSMPKFELSYKLNLVPILERIGLGMAFNPNAADFSGMGSTGGQNLFLSSAIHEVKIRVNEKGTEAAAATAIGVDTAAAPYEETPPVYLTFDKPYYYAVVDLSTNLPLFLGVMGNPAAS